MQESSAQQEQSMIDESALTQVVMHRPQLMRPSLDTNLTFDFLWFDSSMTKSVGALVRARFDGLHIGMITECLGTFYA